MKSRRLISISLVVTFLICILFYNLHSKCYTKQSETIARDILSNAHSWQELLIEAVVEESISEEHARELLSENSIFVRAIEYEPEYSGIYLVTEWMFPNKEGILVSTLEIEHISLERNAGIEIEFMGSVNDLFLYRLHYYWD